MAEDAGNAHGHNQTARETARQALSLLAARCLECHDADAAEGGYRMATIGQLSTAGDSARAPLVPGDPTASELFRRLTSEDADERMPAGGPAFSKQEIELVKRWIEKDVTGAPFPANTPLAEVSASSAPMREAPEHYPRPLPVIALASISGNQIGRPQIASADHTEKGVGEEASRAIVVGGYHELIWIRPERSSLRQRTPGFGPFISAIEPRPGRPQLAVAHGTPGSRGSVTLLARGDSQASDATACWSGNDLPGDLAFSPDGDRLAIGSRDGNLRVIAVDSGETLFAASPHADAILDVCWSSDGEHVMTASRDRTARAIRLEDGRAVSNFTSHERAVFAIAEVEAGALTMDQTGMLRLWSTGNKKKRLERQLNRDATVGIAVHRDELFIVEPQRIIRTSVAYEKVDDGKDEEGNAKTRTIIKWQDATPLTIDPTRVITSLAVGDDGTVWAGTHDGMVYGWPKSDEATSFPAFPQQPESPPDE